jgi:transcriptional regulator with GAF, ATPase, and Fis domain
MACVVSLSTAPGTAGDTGVERPIIASSVKMREVLRQVATVAQTDASVLVCGETGTGKELIARAVHARSRRASQAFVRMNCRSGPDGALRERVVWSREGSIHRGDRTAHRPLRARFP